MVNVCPIALMPAAEPDKYTGTLRLSKLTTSPPSLAYLHVWQKDQKVVVVGDPFVMALPT